MIRMRRLSGPDAAGAAPAANPRTRERAWRRARSLVLGAPRLAEMSRFLDRLAAGPLVADGGMGALLASAVPRLRCPEEANVRAPESVVDVHVGYIRAGADIIETNTFGANRPKLAQHFIEDEFEAINSAAVRLAREAREIGGREVFIAGSIGPLGELRGAAAAGQYADQATVLEGRGVDLFMVETFYDLDDLETAVAAVRSVSQ